MPRLLPPCCRHAAVLQQNCVALSGSPRDGQQGAWTGSLLPSLDAAPHVLPPALPPSCRPQVLDARARAANEYWHHFLDQLSSTVR